MSVTAADVHDFIDQYAGPRPMGQQGIDRIIRVLNEHRCCAGTVRSLAPMEATNVLSVKTSPESV